MPGPAKRSNSFKKSVGSRKLHSGEDLAPEPLAVAPLPPKDLGKVGKDEWKRLTVQLVEQELLTDWDLPTIKMMCVEWQTYCDAVEDIRANGSYQKSNSGYEQQRPIVSERDKAFANYQRLADKFGGNPTSRAKIKRVKPQQVKENPFGNI